MSGKLFLPILPFDTIQIDILGTGRKTSHGNLYILVAVDMASRYAWAFPMRNREAIGIAKLLVERIFVYGTPKYLVSDRAAELTSGHMKEILDELAIKHHRNTPYNPQSNAAVERFNRSILQILRALLIEYAQQWDEMLAWAVRLYNNSWHEGIQNTPNWVMFLCDDNLNYDALKPPMPHHDNTVTDRAKNAAHCLALVRESIARTQKKCQDRENVTQKATIDVGDIVFARTVYTGRRDTKLLAPFHGPFRVLDIKGNTGVLKSFVTNRMSAVSLRNVKLVCPSGFSQTKQGQIFPDYLSDRADFSDTEVSRSPHIVRVRSQDDLSSLDFDVTDLEPSVSSQMTPECAPGLIASPERSKSGNSAVDIASGERRQQSLVGNGAERPNLSASCQGASDKGDKGNMGTLRGSSTVQSPRRPHNPASVRAKGSRVAGNEMATRLR